MQKKVTPQESESSDTTLSRRQLIKTGAVGTVGLLAGSTVSQAQIVPSKQSVADGRIRQSVMGWCFRDRMDVPTLAKHCKDIGLVAMEGISADHYPMVKALGMDVSLVSGAHGFAKGPCNPEYHDLVVNGLSEGIDLAKEVGCKNVITFTGMRFDGMDEEKAAQRCVDTWKEVIGKAEKNGITLVLEHLNSRDDTHPMKGHPGYFGDDVDFCIDLIKQVGSENFKLLFDIYHVSVMNGDIIRRINQYKDYIGHYHTAGNPGRGEIDGSQEIHYPPIFEAILETGYEGFIAHEFIPTWDDAVATLQHAAQLSYYT
ncbi:TIM barrel protein [Opitutales bacterium]|jgi:hydroxypyruvate isomerase|nr:TIM barrel protein [Opitutales bacterium]